MRLASLPMLLALSLGACQSVEPDTGLDQTAIEESFDYNRFVCEAQPVLIRRCSFLACHGDATHAFRVYSAGKLRLTPPTNRDERDAPLTADEVERNYLSAAGVLLGATVTDRESLALERLPLLRKPLAARWGGDEHAGVAIFPVPPIESPSDDPEWSALVAWTAGSPLPKPLATDCTDLFDTLGLQPR